MYTNTYSIKITYKMQQSRVEIIKSSKM